MKTTFHRITGSKWFLLSLAMMFTCANVVAQGKFYCRVSDNNIAKNETLQIDYVIENAGSINDVQLPEFRDFAVISGPNQSSETSVVNGTTTSSFTLSFLVQPKGPGKFVIPAASARINNKTMQTNTVNVIVGNRMSKNTQQPSMPSMNMGFPPMDMQDFPDEDVILGAKEDYNEKVKKNLLVVLQVNKTNCFVGEPIVATYKLCSRLKSESRVTKRPSLDGFSVYDMVDMQTASPSVENIDGKPFTVHLIRKVQLYPLQAGSFTLDPVELDNKVRFLRTTASAKQSRDPIQQMMDGFGNQTWEEHNVTLASKPVTITVKPLPDAKPASFKGAVGNFTLDAKLSTQEVHAEDDATLSVTIGGAGNMPLVNAPSVSFPQGFEAFDASVKEDVDKSVAPIAGSKQFDFLFVPSDTGNFTIAPITFSYFDPAANTYKTLNSQPLSIHVLKALHKRKKSDKAKATIQPLSTNTGLAAWWYWIAGGIAVILLLLLFFRRKKAPAVVAKKETEKPAPQKPVVIVPEKPKEPVVEPSMFEADPLETSRKALSDNNSRQFFSSIQNTLWEAVSKKTGLPPSKMDKRTALQLLQENNVSLTVRTELESLLNTCEMALYMPQSASDMQNVLYKSTFVVNALKG
ncbi:BatD family protein [Pinibacter aurantiacus]|uniref:BatD family protein n=1 Tax=Pinibacter aurantiacus TaxID=2851599 RepID=A0A9E2W340_9BACT|nr:BatD family protein [Pinibacter aurantiacus]MBV4356419.1 BatD family protein [Pinibacter aurantiacus]